MCSFISINKTRICFGEKWALGRRRGGERRRGRREGGGGERRRRRRVLLLLKIPICNP